MIGKIDINNPDERGLLPYPVILAATKGDPDAMKIVMQHYASYIAYLSTTGAFPLSASALNQNLSLFLDKESDAR